MWWIIIGGIIALVGVILIILFFQGAIEKGQGVTNDKFDSLADCDNDKASNFMDECPCDPNIQTKAERGDRLCASPVASCEGNPVCKS